MTSSTANGGERPNSTNESRRFLTHRAPLLRLQIIGVGDKPDRATLYPADTVDIDRMKTWLTVDASIVRDLSNCR
ncbi:DUF7511 domain-containing protein [Halolamina pelagica]